MYGLGVRLYDLVITKLIYTYSGYMMPLTPSQIVLMF